MKPLCFILMPFGRRPAGDGRVVDFDAVHARMIAPAVAAAGLEPLRADEEMTGGAIHEAMVERLVLCEFAVADLTTANADVFYGLGLRHAVRPAATQMLFAEGWGRLPFDATLLRAMPYALAPDGTPADPGRDAAVPPVQPLRINPPRNPRSSAGCRSCLPSPGRGCRSRSRGTGR